MRETMFVLYFRTEFYILEQSRNFLRKESTDFMAERIYLNIE